MAQDAFGALDRPLLLFDSRSQDPESVTPSGPDNTRAPSFSWMPGGEPRAQSPATRISHARSRSSTISGASSSWTRATKDSETSDRLSGLLDCMFGVSTATKHGTSTKMHLLPGLPSAATDSGRRPESTPAALSTASRSPLLRARTSHPVVGTQRLPLKQDHDIDSRDSILVTRMFSVPLAESQETLASPQDASAKPTGRVNDIVSGRPATEQSPPQTKKRKLVEKKTPVFAIGLLFYLPRPSDTRTGTSPARPHSRASFNPSPSTPDSLGSSAQSSWTFLNAVPESLASPNTESPFSDRGVEAVVNNWHVILRSLADIEQVCRVEIRELLQQVNSAMAQSTSKAPKGPAEQRTNQRNVYLRTPNALSQIVRLRDLAKHILWRVSYAMRIPRVVTGLGFLEGHWLDEARHLVRICGGKQQNFFLFNLLTAFLGNHTEWLERFGPDWYRKQVKSQNKAGPYTSALASRTIIVSDHRSTARRLIFLLASFLPDALGTDALQKMGNVSMSPLATQELAVSSSAGNVFGAESLRRGLAGKSRDDQSTFGQADLGRLSASASSRESVGAISNAKKGHPLHKLDGRDSETASIRHSSLFGAAHTSGAVHKTVATSSTATPNAGTPVSLFSTKLDSYFTDGALAESDESAASADLARILRRNSSSYTQSNPSGTTWGSLISNVSGLWNRKQDHSVARDDGPVSPKMGNVGRGNLVSSTPVPIRDRPQTKLEQMVDEASVAELRSPIENQDSVPSISAPSGPRSYFQPPRLRVDDKDGVIDVEIPLPGFIGWTEPTTSSPSSSSQLYRVPSSGSFDGINSIHSSKSRATPLAEDGSSMLVHVAGFLKRYHEDFSLQAVKPYQELQDEIRQSMLREPTPSDDAYCSSPEQGHTENSPVTVCTTLIADLRTFTIQRLTLRRKRTLLAQSVGPDSRRPANHDPRSQPLSDGRGGTVISQEAQTRVEEFLLEPVMDFDTTLTDAIERVLTDAESVSYKAREMPRSHSRTISAGTASSRPHALESHTRNWQRHPISSWSDCQQAVVSALEEVVKSVNDDLIKHQQGRDVDGRLNESGEPIEQEMKHDNVLREGVKRWLLNVETRRVW